MDPAWFRGFVGRCHQRPSFPSVQEWAAAHEQLYPGAGTAARSGKSAAGAAADPACQVQHSPRNDARTVATAAGLGVDLTFPPDSSSIADFNIFKDRSLHDQAAATIASASQSQSGFRADMPEGEALQRFRAYLSGFVAPHWLMTFYKEQEVQFPQDQAHDQEEKHAKFVEDLVHIAVEGVRATGGDAEAAQEMEESIRSLSKRLSCNRREEENLIVFSSFSMNRANSSKPVIYGIFYTTVHARYLQKGNTEVLPSSITTYSFNFNLIGAVLIQYEALYNRFLPKASVEDWLNAHHI